MEQSSFGTLHKWILLATECLNPGSFLSLLIFLGGAGRNDTLPSLPPKKLKYNEK